MLKTIGTFVCVAGLAMFQTAAAHADPRVALVIGNSGYRGLAPSPFAAADATAVSETLRAAGYAVTDIRDLTQSDSGRVMRDFLDKIAESGAEADAFIYFSGYGAQIESENYLIPVDATIRGPGDIANEAFRLNDFLNELAQLQAKTKIVVVDAARDHQIPNVVKGLAVTEVPSGLLVGFASAPMTVSIEGEGPYSLYAASLVTQMRDPALEIADVFKTARMSVNKATSAAQIPWSVSALTVQFRLFEQQDAQQVDQQTQTASLRPSNRIRTKQDLRALSAEDAYQAAIELDTLKAYQWFVELYPKDPRAAEIWEIIAKRREALLWRRSAARNTKTAYWNYMKRYPQSPYVQEARERLVFIGAPPEPPIDYLPAPEPLPEDYVDEAVGVPELFVEGMAAMFAAFEPDPPIFVPAPVFLVRPPIFGIRPPIFGPAPFIRRGDFAGGRRPPVLPAFNNLRNPQNIARTNFGRHGQGMKSGLAIPQSKFAGGRGPHGGMGQGGMGQGGMGQGGMGGFQGQRPMGLQGGAPFGGGRNQGLTMPPSTRPQGGLGALPGGRPGGQHGMSGMGGRPGGVGLPPVPGAHQGGLAGRPTGAQGLMGAGGQKVRPTFGPGSRQALGGRSVGGRQAFGGRSVGGRQAFGGRSVGGRQAFGGRSVGGRQAFGGRSVGGRQAYGGRSVGGRQAYGGRSMGGRQAYGGRSVGGRQAFGGRSMGGRQAFGGRSMGGRPAFGGGRPAFGGGRPAFGGGRPAFGGGRPAFGGGRPAFGGGRPAFGGGRPAFGGGRSFGGGRPMGGGFSRPASRPSPVIRRR